MSIERNARIPLAPSEPRCTPAGHCAQQTSCARRLAMLPASGAKLLSAQMPSPHPLFGGCIQFLSIEGARNGAAKQPAPAAKKWPGAAA